jgi:arylsulfatase A-like enzyme
MAARAVEIIEQFGVDPITAAASVSASVSASTAVFGEEKEEEEEEGEGQATKTVNKKAVNNQPLFLYLPFQAVHWPLEAPASYVSKYDGKTGGNHARQMVCAMAKTMDDAIGNVTAALKRRGMWEDTIVIFSSDNGGPTNGNEGTWSSNFPLRGGKNTIWEGGTRVVGAIRGPGIPKGGKETFEKFHATDWLPTLVSMAAGEVRWVGMEWVGMERMGRNAHVKKTCLWIPIGTRVYVNACTRGYVYRYTCMNGWINKGPLSIPNANHI